MPEAAQEVAQGVTVKTPYFSETSVPTWFKILEAHFHIKGITISKRKFYHLLSCIPVTAVDSVPAEILEKEDYNEFKSAMIANFEESKTELFENLYGHQL